MENSQHQSTAVIVLGMHRSGTSAVMRACNLLGVALGERLFGARADNPKGFWEHTAAIDINEEIFRSFGYNSQDLGSFPEDWPNAPFVQAQEARLVEEMRKDFAASPVWGLKDPRMGRLMPLWKRIFTTLHARAVYLIPLRHPLEVAGSLHARDGISIEHGLALWLRYSLALERDTRDEARYFFTFPAFLADWQSVMRGAARKLAFHWPTPPEQAEAAMQAFLAPELKHHALPDAALNADPRVADYVRTAYTLLLEAARTQQPDAAALDAINAQVELLYQPIGNVSARKGLEISALHRELAAAEERLAAVQSIQPGTNTRPWYQRWRKCTP